MYQNINKIVALLKLVPKIQIKVDFLFFFLTFCGLIIPMIAELIIALSEAEE